MGMHHSERETLMSDVNVVTDLDDDVSSDDELPGGLDSSPLDFAVAILSGTWVNGSLEDRQNFRNDFANLYKAVSTLRVKLDATIWQRHENGQDTVKDLPSIRAPRTGAKPGRKPAEKTLAEKLLGK